MGALGTAASASCAAAAAPIVSDARRTDDEVGRM